MKHTMKLFIEKKRETKFMRMLDLFEDCKYLVEIVELSFTTATEINDDYFMNFIEKSTDSELRILAIEYMNNFYHHPEVKVLSDGKYMKFLS